MSNITMGNDEFILYIRKYYPTCNIKNKYIGRKIWEWIQNNDPNAELFKEDRPCLWQSSTINISEDKLPKTAAEFVFDRKLLPALYSYIDSIVI
jgi:hypothetical protein